MESQDLARWIGDGAVLDENPDAEAGMSYLFRRSGPVALLPLRTMGESGIVLIGAGVALIVGWGLLKWPGESYVPPVLVVAFAIACLAVWQAGPILVLLQPAIFGLLLAIGGVWLDATLKRRIRSRATMTLGSPSGFLTSGSSVPRSPAVVAGSDDHTSIRAQALPPTETAGHLSESGSRS
jgi:hypothetical protein